MDKRIKYEVLVREVNAQIQMYDGGPHPDPDDAMYFEEAPRASVDAVLALLGENLSDWRDGALPDPTCSDGEKATRCSE